MSGNLCPFMSVDTSYGYCLGSCKFYSNKFDSQCLIVESCESLLTIHDEIQDIKSDLQEIKDRD